MPVGIRQLKVLGEFKPFGLVAEALDGKPSENVSDNYHYFLFDADVTKQIDAGANSVGLSPPSGDRSDHEIFIRGNRIIWSAGSRVYKRFTLPSPVIKACWCRMRNMSEALLCVLHGDSLTIYNTSGEVVSVPLSHTVTAIWALPVGLLLQQAYEGNSLVHTPFPSSSPQLSSRYILRPRRDLGAQHNYTPLHASDINIKGDGASMSSHLILTDPLEEPQLTYIEERGKLNIMREFDEITIWTADHAPLMASYNRAKMQHSVWVAEVTNSKLFDSAPEGMLPKQVAFRRIWQGKISQTAASKVFLATDDDVAPIICFFLQEQKKMLSVRLQFVEINGEIIYDVKPDMSWSIQALDVSPLSVTRPSRAKAGMPLADIVVLTPESTILLYSGKLCLCSYMLPSFVGEDLFLQDAKASGTTSVLCDLKIVGLADAVDGRINVIVNTGQTYRCTLRCNPSSSLANDCFTALAEGLNPTLFNHFLHLLWADGNSAYLAEAESGVDLEWESLHGCVKQLCRKSNHASEVFSHSATQTSWEFLTTSRYHKHYSKNHFVAEFLPRASFDMQGSDSTSYVDSVQPDESPENTELLIEIMDSLHAVYESLKLDNLRKRDLGLLVVLLCDIAYFLHEATYLDYYIRDFPSLSKDFGICHPSSSPRKPPSLFRWLENCLLHGCHSAGVEDLPLLICKDGSSVINWARKVVAFYSLLCGGELLGSKLSSGVVCTIASGSFSTPDELTVLAMVGERFGLQQLDLLPGGVSLPLRHALDICRESPPMSWPAAAYVLVGREDLAYSCLAHSGRSLEIEPHKNVNLISVSAPYMLHLHPVTTTSSVSDALELEDVKLEDADSIEAPVIDGMEHIFNSSTQLIYGRDLRLNEVRRLLCSARPVAIQTSPNPTASDQELQQAQLWQLAQRTTALPFGRGAFTLATTHTLLTEAVTVPKLVLAGRLPAQQNATVNLDPNVRNLQELKSWPEFHNAVAAGLRLASLQGKVSRTWILYNRPVEPNSIHAGLLLALGLQGHLRVLNISDIYTYYEQGHESTSVGLMLGLAASHRGTMEPVISKSLYVHLPARHPSSFPELEVPTLLQSASLLSIGLLYEGSAHPQTLQILLGEIGRRSGGDNVLEREGYAVSAGFSLGLVALGRGEDAIGFMGTLIDRLFQYIGGKEIQNERFHRVTQLADEHGRIAGQVMDEGAINIDVTAPGAIFALALMYLKTDSELIVSRLSIPQTQFDLQYVRPDFIMLRVIARNLIMWSRVHPTEDWIRSQIPEFIQHGVSSIGDETGDTDEMDTEALAQAYVNIVVGSCISLGLIFAGTRDGRTQELLYKFALYFLNEIKPVTVTSRCNLPRGLSSYVDRSTLETCLHLVVLSLCVVMAGSGHLQTFKLLKFLRNRSSADGHPSYGIQTAVSLAIGFLFLGGGLRSFSTSNSSVAYLLITMYPRLPTGANDNRCHLQAFRHLYVLATEARWIQTVDVDTGLPVYAPLVVTLRETEQYAETSFCEIAPCVLPERAALKAVRVCGPRYWPHVIELIPEEKPWWSSGDKTDPFNSGVLHIKRKVGACSYVDDPVGCQSLLSRAMHKVFGFACGGDRAPDNARMITATVDQVVSIFSSDPSLNAFAQFCCNSSGSIRPDAEFQEFCLQVLFDCVSKDRPTLLQVYLSFYTAIASMVAQVINGACTIGDSLFLSSIKLALAYNEALLSGRLKASGGPIVQSTFLGSIRKRVEEILDFSLEPKNYVSSYIKYGSWPYEQSLGSQSSILLSWYLQWYGVPSHNEIEKVVEKVEQKAISMSVPLLHLVFPRTHIAAIGEINKYRFSFQVDD